MNTYLLTWNPSRTPEGSDYADMLLNSIGQTVTWACMTRQIKIGDMVFLARLGVESQGIVASGIVTEESFLGEGWSDTSKQQPFIEFKLDEFRPACSDGLLPILLLKSVFPDQQWSPQGSGIEISSEISNELKALWEKAQGQHSFVPILEKCQQLVASNDAERLQNYREAHDLITQIRNKGEFSQKELKKFWLEPYNGVASVGNGLLYEKDYTKNYDLLNVFAKEILTAPTKDTLQSISNRWQSEKIKGNFSRNNWSVIHRFFAVCAPEKYTILIQDSDLKIVIDTLHKQFEFSTTYTKDDWFTNNQHLLHEIREHLGEKGEKLDPFELNTALWSFYLLIKKPDLARGQQNETTDINNLQEKEQIPMLPDSINTILYGPPGTGKTYKTIELAVKASEPSFEPSFELSLIDKRTAIKEKYDELVKAGRIQFITFHQSFSYEEFIEGIRAETQEGTVYYEVKSGAFKEICERASDAEKVFVKINPTETNRANTHLSFDEAIEAFKADLADGTLVELQTLDRGKSFRVQYNSSQTLQIIPNATGLSRDVPIREILLFHDEKKLLDESRHQSYIQPIYTYIQETYLQPSSRNQSNISSPSTTVAKPNFVLIIDEINRGNISKIFGELITLIEPSKRKGQKEALSLCLPYSKESFSVPSNLHIIGTMNTADRSLALIDTALRRRFVFTEMMPEYEALKPITIEGINLGALLYTMNQRIECLYDREHTLGHAFFLPILQEDESERMEALGKVMCHKILPLLQEYFFEDWEKIRLVLGDNQKKNDTELQFVREIPVTSKVLFGNTDDEYESNAKCYTVNHKAFYNPDAYLGYTDTVSPDEAESE